MEAGQLTNPAFLLFLAVLALGFVPFGIWWVILRIVLAPLLRPIGLILIVMGAAAAAIQYGG